MLSSKLNSIKLPHSALWCSNVCCTSTEHIHSLNEYANDIAAACLISADTAIPVSGCRGARGCIPGWTEFIAPLQTNSLCWHNIWTDCGRPHNGIVADIMRKTRAQYHAAIRKARKDEANIVNERFTLALSNNCNRDFWKEVKRIRGRTYNVSSVVGGQSSSADIANTFASKYSDLYSCISYDIEDMELICSELNMSVKNDGYDGASAVNVNDIMSAIRKLKSGKRDGSLGLCTDHKCLQ